ncbi:MAG: type IV pilus biogenesis/stability protein PilW [Pseudomonadales bacterium]
MSRFLQFSAALLAVLMLASCVTTESKVFTADTSPERAVEARVNLAMSYFRQNDFESARRNLVAALEIDDKSPAVHNALGLVFGREGDLPVAEKHFKRAVSLDPDYSPARNNYAALLYNDGRYKAALKQLEVVVEDELYEGRMVALGNMGKVALKLDDNKKAEATFKHMLNIDSRNLLALLELSHMSYDAKNYNLSSALYDKYRAIAPKQSARGLFLGVRLAEAITDTDARASYALALRNLYPESEQYKLFLSGNYE